MPLITALLDTAQKSARGRLKLKPYKWQKSRSLAHTAQAAEWCSYLESHARRIYSCVTTPQMRAAQELAEKIKKRNVGADGLFACRDVYVKGWSSLDSPEAVRQAAHVLLDAGWIREQSGEVKPLGGRPSNQYQVNSLVWK